MPEVWHIVPRTGLRGYVEQGVFVLFFPLHQIAYAFSAYLLLLAKGGRRTRLGLLAYTTLALVDPSPRLGGWSWAWHLGITRLLRGSWLWRMSAAGRGPFTMVRSCPLPPDDGPYIFTNHPHGIIGIAPMTNFGTTVSGFSDLFPGIKVHLLGATSMFRVPFFREWCLLHGHGTVDRSCCLQLLKKGHSIALAPGGARESLESQPGTMRLILKRRKGFARLAVATGAALVPALTFGENELYNTVQFERGTWGRWCQRAFQNAAGFAVPIFYGRSMLFPFFPKRSEVFTVVGFPLRPDDVMSGGEKVIEEAVDALHAKYCISLRELFDKHKADHGLANAELELV